MAERLVVIGGDAAGMSAAVNARRLNPGMEIVALERGDRTSYSACGIPYLVAGDVNDPEALVARTPQEFRDAHQIDVRVRHEAIAVDLAARRVHVRDLAHDRDLVIPFDQLLFATGAHPSRPDLPGVDLPFVRTVKTIPDGEWLRQWLGAAPERPRVVVVGAGYVGLEMAEAFLRHGAEVTVLQRSAQVMTSLDADVAEVVATAMNDLGVVLRTGVEVQGFEPGRVLCADGPLDADLVVLATGVAPSSRVASEAGVATGAKGAIVVDARQRTGVEGVWAAGDCATSLHLVSGAEVHVALGTVANKQGRVAGVNIGGGYARFPGVLGTAITKLCDVEIGRSGLTESGARQAGFEPVSATISSSVRAGYMPDAGRVMVRLVAERDTGRLLGGQIVGDNWVAKRIDTVAAALTARLGVGDLIDMDLSYAPPFSSVWDIVQVAARRLQRQLGSHP